MIPKLTTQKIAFLKNHFKTWIVTDKCQETFEHILARAISIRILEEDEKISLDREKGSLFIEFQGTNWSDEPEPVWAIFSPVDKNNTGLKDAITNLHKEILLFKPESDSKRLNFPSFMYEHFIEDQEEEDIDRYIEFCDLAQDCVVADTENLNSFNEPKLCFFSHGDNLNGLDPYDGQDVDAKEKYNYGGFILRMLAHIIYDNDASSEMEKLYEEFSS
ncbi:hypothetical protein PJW08_07730 [Tenacibaculum finnmarkense]|nr:hypothetical protein PJW08_07730 [Tenacibaculum finnmarkense]